jgi:hypothetical protein
MYREIDGPIDIYLTTNQHHGEVPARERHMAIRWAVPKRHDAQRYAARSLEVMKSI